tara:strand:- start:81 stop:455 length:375 start_codon:yes stop_codon:yes gene_type:complete
MKEFNSILFKVGLVFILGLFLVFCTASLNAKEADIRMICFKKVSINTLVEADKYNQNLALLIFKKLVADKKCAFYLGGTVTIKDVLEIYKDSKGRETQLVTIEDKDKTVYYSIITSSKIKGIKV